MHCVELYEVLFFLTQVELYVMPKNYESTERLDSRTNDDRASNSTERGEKNAACDRCRGQKLRCIWESVQATKCRRCTRADAICTVLPRRPMGRPSHHDRDEYSRSRGNGEYGSFYKRPRVEHTQTPRPPADSHRMMQLGEEDMDVNIPELEETVHQEISPQSTINPFFESQSTSLPTPIFSTSELPHTDRGE